MTAIERAARAMYDNVKPDWDWDDPDAELLRAMYRENARAAIAAIREPTHPMQAAAFNQKVSFRSGSGMSDLGQVSVEYDGEPDKGAATIYRAMIDAMLEEG